MRDVDCVSLPKTVSRMDAGFEPPWMGSRCVFGSDTRFMSRCQYMSLRPLLTTDMNRKHLVETRHEPIRGGSASASLRLTVSARCFQSMPLDIYLRDSSAIALFLNEMTLAVLIAGRLILTMSKLDRIV